MSRLSLITLLGYCLLSSSFTQAQETTWWQRLLQNDPLTLQKETPPVTLSVIDTYLELHTGPGRGYPIFHVIEQGQEVKVLRRRSNWFYVSDRRNIQGWVKQENLARTLAPTGLPAALPDIQHGDFLAQQGRVGFSVGQLGNDYIANVTAGYRILSWAGIEVEYGQIFRELRDGRSYGTSVIFEPIKNWSFTPFISKGLAWQEWKKKTVSSVGTNSLSSNSEFTGAGINYYIGFNFVVRGEYRQVLFTNDDGTTSNSEWRLGFSSFF